MAQAPDYSALSETERLNFEKLFRLRQQKVEAKTAEVFAFRNEKPPVLVNSAFYHLFGLDPDSIPDGLFEDPAVMTRFQERLYYEQIKAVDDDFVPYLLPWFGCGVAASALGCRLEFAPRMDPTADPRYYPIQTPRDVKRLEIPDPKRDGFMPTVLAYLQYMKENSFLPVSFTDSQGPLTTANQLVGYDKLIYMMNDHPSAVHELMDKITTTQIMWYKRQKEVLGLGMAESFGDQQVYTGAHAGVWFSDDDAPLMSPEIYREFVVPYNSRMLREFGGGILHFCGNATHQVENLLATDGLLGINNYNLHNIKALGELQDKVRGRLVIFACDFTPLEYEPYFREMLDRLSPQGMVIDSQYSPVVGLVKGGRYVPIRRGLEGRAAVLDYVNGLLAR